MHQSASAVGYCRCTTRWLDETEEAIQLFEIFGGYETFATREWTAAIWCGSPVRGFVACCAGAGSGGDLEDQGCSEEKKAKKEDCDEGVPKARR